MNIAGKRVHPIWDDATAHIPPVDLVVCNPPFHVEYETDVELPLRLFAYAHRVLRPGGRLVLVANRHLNYSTRLSGIFAEVKTIAQSEKFEVLEAAKGM
jgi:16S rRNA G1207 methylase RsmC